MEESVSKEQQPEEGLSIGLKQKLARAIESTQIGGITSIEGGGYQVIKKLCNIHNEDFGLPGTARRRQVIHPHCLLLAAFEMICHGNNFDCCSLLVKDKYKIK